MKVLVFGGSGQVGQHLKRMAPQFCYADRKEADFEQPELLPKVIQHHEPQLIVNLAAFTDVPRAEQERDRAFLVNAKSVETIGIEANIRKIPLIHISTDFVFSGEGDRPYFESDATGPLNVYAKSKAAGEEALKTLESPYLILRTSWVYHATGKNFFTKIMELLQTKERVMVVDDQVGAPTYAPHFASALLKLIKVWASESFRSTGIYHMANTGFVSRFAVAQIIFKSLSEKAFPLKTTELLPAKTVDFPDPIKRPLNSRLDLNKLKTSFGVELPPWQQGIEDCIESFLESQYHDERHSV